MIRRPQAIIGPPGNGNLTFEVPVATATSRPSAPRELEALSSTEDAVALSWREDSCATAYVVSATNSECFFCQRIGEIFILNVPTEISKLPSNRNS